MVAAELESDGAGIYREVRAGRRFGQRARLSGQQSGGILQAGYWLMDSW